MEEERSDENVLDDELIPSKYARIGDDDGNTGPPKTATTSSYYSVLATKALTIVLQRWLIPDMSWLPNDMESRLTSLKEAIVEDKEKLLRKLKEESEDDIKIMTTSSHKD